MVLPSSVFPLCDLLFYLCVCVCVLFYIVYVHAELTASVSVLYALPYSLSVTSVSVYTVCVSAASASPLTGGDAVRAVYLRGNRDTPSPRRPISEMRGIFNPSSVNTSTVTSSPSLFTHRTSVSQNKSVSRRSHPLSQIQVNLSLLLLSLRTG